MFEGTKLKLQRANYHIDDLNSKIIHFLGHDNHSCIIHRDPHTLKNFLELSFIKTVPDDWALIIGDAVQNLRSALDIMICELTGNFMAKFPFDAKRQNLEDTIIKGPIKIPKIRDTILNDIKPYEAGNYTLWAMNKLSVIDKHKLIVPVLGVTGIQGLKIENKETGEAIPNMYFALLNTSLIYELPTGKLELKNKGKVSFRIAFGADTFFDGKNCVSTLYELHKTVTDVVNIIENVAS